MRGGLIALSLLAGIIVPAGSALAAGSGSIGIRLVDVVPDSRNPLARSYIVDRVAPGTSIRRRVEIVNTTGSTADVSIYPAAASLRRSKFAFAPGHSGNELSSWTSVSRGVLRLAPGRKTVETVTVDVPQEASSGERYAVIWAEVSAPAPAGGGVTLVNRVGVRMYLSIGPGGAPPSNFVIRSLAAKRSASGERLVVARVHNSGQRTLEISGHVTLSKGPGGLSAGPVPVKLGTALTPGESRLVNVRLDKQLPRGPWRAQMRLRSGSIQRVAVASITFPRASATANAPTAKDAPRPYRQLGLIGVILLALLAAAAFCTPVLRARLSV
jgi:hypothetical protein